MQLTRSADYGVRAVLHIAEVQKKDKDSVCLSDEIAEEQEIPKVYVPKVLQTLTRAGILRSRRGRNGGFLLARPAEKISLLDVIEAVEGPLFLNQCLIGSGECSMDSSCRVHPVWRKVQVRMSADLRRATIASLL